MRAIRPLLLLPVLLGACAEEPFVDHGTTVSLEKPRNELAETGSFTICHASETPMSEVLALAQEQCGGYGLVPYQHPTQRWQCRTSAPHRTQFSCYNPEMLGANGNPINPFDKAAVAVWEKRTGKKLVLLNPNLQGLSQPSEPAPAQAPEVRDAPSGSAPPPALRADDMAGKAPLAPPPPVPKLAPPPPPAAPSEGGFTLPQGSWGDSFEQ